MKLFSILIVLLGFHAFAQTTLHKGKIHMIAILDQNDSQFLYNRLDIKEVETKDGLVKTMGPEDKLAHISCTNQNRIYSCILMLKLYNLKKASKRKRSADQQASFYLTTEIDKDKVDSWYKSLDIPNQDFGDNHYFKEFLASDEAVYFNCRSHMKKKTCKLGIIL